MLLGPFVHLEAHLRRMHPNEANDAAVELYYVLTCIVGKGPAGVGYIHGDVRTVKLYQPTALGASSSVLGGALGDTA